MKKLKDFLNLTYYTSGIDDFLFEYDKEHPQLSTSQRAEINKYARIFALRDHSDTSHPEEKFWDNF